MGKNTGKTKRRRPSNSNNNNNNKTKKSKKNNNNYLLLTESMITTPPRQMRKWQPIMRMPRVLQQKTKKTNTSKLYKTPPKLSPYWAYEYPNTPNSAKSFQTLEYIPSPFSENNNNDL
jgi:hypothetical protein